MIRAACFAVTVVLLPACSAEEGPDEQRIEYLDEGVACLGSYDGGDVAIEGDGRATVFVTFDGCASGCARNLQARCNVTIDGTTIEVTGSASLDVPRGVVDCPAQCVFVQARCDTPVLADGAYALRYAGDTATFDIPSMAMDVCTSAPF